MTSEDSYKVAWQEQLELNGKFTRKVDELKQEVERLTKSNAEWEALAARYEVGVSQWKEYAESCKKHASQWEDCANRSAQHVDTLTAEKEVLQREIEALRSSHLPDTLLVDVEIPGVVGEVIEGMREREQLLGRQTLLVHDDGEMQSPPLDSTDTLPLQLAGKPEAIREFRKRILRGAISTLCWIEQMDRAVKS